MKNSLKSVTVEPTLLLFVVVQEWMTELDSNLFLQKACRFNITTEPDLNTKCDDQKRGILFVSEFYSSYAFAVSFLNMVLVIFAAIWSDEAGRRRRPLIFFPIIGLVSHSLSGCLNSYFWHWIPSTAVVSWTVIRSLCADVSLLLTFCQMYICDVSDAENRTLRLGIVAAIRMVGVLLGRGGSGLILRRIGFFYFYVLCFVLSVTSFVCGFIFIQDRSEPVERKIWFSRMFSLKRILLVDAFKVVFSRKLGIKRVIVLLLIIGNLVNVFTITGEMSVLYLYLRHKFMFDEQMYSRYLLCKMSLIILGVVFCSFVLSKRFKIHDGLIGILATLCDTLAIAALLFATETWQLFSSNLLDMFHTVGFTISISFMSKYYKNNELGRLNAVNSVFLLAVPLSYPIYNQIFQKTLDTFPSAYCILSIVLDIGVFIFFAGSYSLSRKSAKKESFVKEGEPMMASNGIATSIEGTG